MKLYIPTSSLNFNNILSSESISPESFYKERGFGYPYWFSIPENDCPFAIVLYESLCAFTRPPSDREDHPLLIEISTEKEYPVLQKGVRYSEGTVYLNPWQTRFLFFSERDRQIAFSMSDSSLETKMIRLYRKNTVVITGMAGSYPALNKVPIQTFNVTQVGFDRKLNKMKGFLYGYYIGAYLSLNEKNRKTINDLREIRDIFAAVLSSPDRMPSARQEKRLKELFRNLLRETPLFQDLLDALGEEGKAYQVVEILNRHGCRVLLDWKQKVRELNSGGKGTKSRTMAWIEKECSQQEALMAQCRKPLSVETKEVAVADGCLEGVSESVIGDSVLQKLYKAWINEVLCGHEYTGDLSPQRERLSDTLTLKAKEILGDAWEESSIKVYMNKLRRHIRGEGFDEKWDNGLLSSMAACLVKGDDWHQMYLFMQKKGMTDYRIAFSFYGILNGFANLTRDYTDILLDMEDKQYIASVYRDFWEQLHHECILVTKTPGQETTILGQAVLDFFDSKRFAYKGSKKKLREGLLKAFSEWHEDMGVECLLTVLDKSYEASGWKKTNKPWKLLAEKFVPDYVEQRGLHARRRGLDGEKDLFSELED